VIIQDVADSELFRIGFDTLGDFCLKLYEDSPWSLKICEKARFGDGRFTVRLLKHGKDESI
jgi:hypothetical protein